MMKLNRIYNTVFDTENLTKAEPTNVLYQISPASDHRFKRVVRALRKSKGFTVTKFKSETSQLRTLIREQRRKCRGKPFESTEEIVNEGGRLQGWVDERITDDDVLQLRKQFDYPVAWHDPISDYVVSGRMPKPSLSSKLIFKAAKDPKKRTLYLVIDGNTNLNDVLEERFWGTSFWGMVEGYQNHLGSQLKTKQRFKRHKKIHMKRDGSHILVSIHRDTSKLTLKEFWKRSGIRELQKKLQGRSKKGRRGLGCDAMKMLTGKEDKITDSERKKITRYRLRQRGLIR